MKKREIYSTKTFDEIQKIAKEIGEIKNVKAIYLFGSVVTGRQHLNSDIDVCVIGELNEKEKTFVFSKFPEKCDICFFNQLPIYIKMRVFTEGKLLLIKDKKYIYSLQSLTLKQYLDFKPHINRFCKETLKCTI